MKRHSFRSGIIPEVPSHPGEYHIRTPFFSTARECYDFDVGQQELKEDLSALTTVSFEDRRWLNTRKRCDALAMTRSCLPSPLSALSFFTFELSSVLTPNPQKIYF